MFYARDIKCAFALYKCYYLRSVCLETLANVNVITIDRYADIVIDSHTISWKAVKTDITKEILYLGKIGLVQISAKKEFSLTDKGKKALQECLLESLSSNAFIGYRSFCISRWTLIVSVLALLVAAISLIVAVC